MGDDDLVEAMARAIFDCEDPHTGDPVGATIHSADEHAYGDGTVEQQIANVLATCRAAARAALKTYREQECLL